MYGHKSRTPGSSGIDYYLMPMEALSLTNPASSPPPPLHSTYNSTNPPPVDWILKKERIFLLAQFWQQRATLAEKKVTSLKEQLANNNSGSSSGTMAPPPPEDSVISTQSHTRNEEFELAAKDKEISGLIEDIQRLQSSLNHLRESSAAQIRLLEEQLDQKQEVISRLEARLDSQRDYEDLQRELVLLKGQSSMNENSLTVNGFDAKDSNDKRSSSSPNSLASRFILGPSPALPVEAFGSLLGEELVATWRRSLERSLLSRSPPAPIHNSSITSLQHGNESSSPPPQQSSPTDSSHNDSNANRDNVSPMNGNISGSQDRMPYRFEDSLIPKSDPMEAKLQEMLRYNMDKFGSQCLDTLQIARRVRELLSIHNIGQRLFAKYVLGLSQGTVSELLSKPKAWDKLTEKGRDSYRKMHAWAADEASVLLLKSLIPKKGKEGSGLPFRTEESGADDRIAHILSEANNALHRNHGPLGSGLSYESVCDDNPGSKSPSSTTNGCSNNGQGPPSPSSTSSRDRRIRKYENDDISQEQVARIYQEELAKLVGLRLPHGTPDTDSRIPRDQQFQSLLFPHLFGGSLLEREDIRVALDAYHRELAKLASNPNAAQFRSALFQPGGTPLIPPSNGFSSVQDLSLPKRSSPDVTDTEDQGENDESNDVMRHVGSAFSLVRPKCEGNGSGAPSPLDSILAPSGGDDSCNASPLQRMASITNSLISQPTVPSVSSPNQRPLKAVLPPITQQQFDQYNNLNTEDIVRKVKEQLSQYSISQRLFGESVLGLSQGSVSDLLARPKPWHMLTQKGREPFIRMKMFLEDDNAVHKLVASQYKIAPEKLMRTGGYSGNPSPVSVPNPPSKPPVKVPEVPKSIDTSPQPLISLAVSQQSGIPPVQEVIKKSPCSQSATATSPVLSSRSNPGCLPQQPSVYEMAALTQDLDTMLITTKIKEALLANNIGQKIFGEVVLGLSQGSVSELLSKPKPWHMLSIKGREPFIRMQLWLADPLNVERLQHLKNERREANKRKRGITHGTSAMDSYTSGTQGSSDASNDSPTESYSPGSGVNVPPSKKQRVLFTDEQKEALKLAFALDPYPNVSAIEFLGRELGLSSRTITNWFHNHRMRLKQQTSAPMIQDSPLSCQPFDPVQFRLLLHQRLLELHKDNYASLPFLGNRGKGLMEEGLDLTVNNSSQMHSDNEDEYFEDDDEEGSLSDDSITSSGSKDLRRRKKSGKLGMNLIPRTSTPHKCSGGGNNNTSGSSRRKPVTTFKFNPSWHDDSEDDEVLINGVCVLQNSTFGKNNNKPINSSESLESRLSKTNRSNKIKDESCDQKIDSLYIDATNNQSSPPSSPETKRKLDSGQESYNSEPESHRQIKSENFTNEDEDSD